MSQFTNLYNNGEWGYMGIGPMPAYPISMTITAPGEFPSEDSYFTCGAGDNWSILAYLPTDRTKYAVMKNTTLGTIYMAGSVYSPSYRIVSNDPLNYPDIPASVTVNIPTDPDAWNFYGGLTSLEGCALCMWVPNTSGSAPNGCDYVSIGESKKSWFSYEDDHEEFAYTIDGNYIYAKRAERDANGNVISSVPASTSADENKVLTVDSSGNPVWATAQGGGSTPVVLPALAYPDNSHNTIRFEFESSPFDPSTDSTLSPCGTWTKVTADPNRNVWDVDTSNTKELFKNKITSSVCMCKILDSYFKITTLSNYFSGCTGLTSFNGAFMTSSSNTSINCAGMFYQCNGLKSVEIHQVDTYYHYVDYYDLKFSSADSMFAYCKELEVVSFGGLAYNSNSNSKVNVVGPAQYLCSDCKKLRTFSGMGFWSLTNATRMFEHCGSLENLSDTNVTCSGSAAAAFSGCAKLMRIDKLEATDLGSAFRGCSHLNSIGLVNASGATSLVEMCYGCSGLSDIYVINTESVTNMNAVFRNCGLLRNIPDMSYAAVTTMNYAFENTKIASGANALYTQLSSLANISSHTNTFTNCGSSTAAGAAELAQIPSSWGGTGA